MTYFGNDSFTVIQEWQQFSCETYSVATVPEAVRTSFNMSTSVQLVMLYNIQYVSVTATLWIQEYSQFNKGIVILLGMWYIIIPWGSMSVNFWEHVRE